MKLITLGVLAYTIMSLKLSWDVYHEVDLSYSTGKNINECYRDARKSLLFGFTASPLLILSGSIGLTLLGGAVYVLFNAVSWIINNMP